MTDDDRALLRAYTELNSEDAFAALMARYINLVYSVAIRRVNEAHLAEEITQAVFIILSRKAALLDPNVILAGWLCRTARHASNNALTIQRRRQRREQEAYMQFTSNESQSDVWFQIAPLLDGAMEQLGQKDHDAIVIRFFQSRNFRHVGESLHVSEEAAKMRVTRALKRLRNYFVKRGVISTTDTIAEAILANSIQVPPATLTHSVNAAASMKGAAATASAISLVNATARAAAWTKYKFVIYLGAGLLLTGIGIVVGLSNKDSNTTSDSGSLAPSQAATAILTKMFESYRSLSNYTDAGLSSENGTYRSQTTSFSIKLGRPNLYSIEWRHSVNDVYDGAIWSSGKGDFELLIDSRFTNSPSISPPKYLRLQNQASTFDAAGNMSGGAAWTIPPVFFGHSKNDGIGLIGQSSDFQKGQDQKVNGLDCYVLTGHLTVTADLPVTLWIGKTDFLIHQSRRTSWLGSPLILLPITIWHKREILTNTETHMSINTNSPSAVEDFDYKVPKGVSLQSR